jgi:hypothetical protein
MTAADTVVPAAGGMAAEGTDALTVDAVAIALLDSAVRTGCGISSFVWLGNKADVSGNDLIAYWYDDPATHAVALYLESFGNPRKFARIVRALSRRKPVMATEQRFSGRASPNGRRTEGDRAQSRCCRPAPRGQGGTRSRSARCCGHEPTAGRLAGHGALEHEQVQRRH